MDKMKAEMMQIEDEFPQEPEVRMMKTTHQALAAEFRQSVFLSQQAASNFKETMRIKLKTFL